MSSWEIVGSMPGRDYGPEKQDDLLEKVVVLLQEYYGTDNNCAYTILALFERSAVERERKAFVAGVCEEGDNTKTLEMVHKTAARRYPLPKEE